MSVFSALSGIRVIDFTSNLAGPFATQILADLGAEVIKIERPNGGDDTRGFPPSWDGESVVFMAVNRNKKSVALDLKSPEGLRVALQLVEGADVVVESFRAGTAQQMGLGYNDVRAHREDIVYCSVSAFGDGEAGREIPGYDPIVQAFCGIMSLTGHPGNPPTRVSASLVDLSTGMWAAIGMLAAISEQRATGRGQLVGATLIDSGYTLMCHQILSYLGTGEVPKQLGSASPITAPYEAFACSDGWVLIAAGNDQLFARLCGALDCPEVLDDPRFMTVEGRTACRAELHALLETYLLQAPAADWIRVIRAAGVPIGPVNTLDQAVAHPIVEERELLTRPVHSRVDGLRLVRLPLTADGAVPNAPTSPPTLGQHTEEVLDQLGLDQDAIARVTAYRPTASDMP